MSRHRDVRNMNLADEMDDDALSDGGEEELTEEQRAQLEDGLEHIRDVIGNEEVSGISDSMIQDGLWESYFSVEETLQWIFAEQEKKTAAMERKANTLSPTSTTSGASSVLPRMPLILRAQQQHLQQVQQELLDSGALPPPSQHQDVDPEYLAWPEDQPMHGLRRLHTISERSERSEVSATLPSRTQFLGVNAPRLSAYSSDGSWSRRYGGSEDPNLIPPSPSGSAAIRMSYYEAPPSPLSTGTRTLSSRPPSGEANPPMESMPDIPDFQSKSYRDKRKDRESLKSGELDSDVPPPTPPKDNIAAHPTSISDKSGTEGGKKQSKLAKLASARAASVKSASSSRNAAQPDAKASMVNEQGPGASLPHLSGTSQSFMTRDSLPSSTSSHVRKAIDAAMQLESMMNEASGVQRASSVRTQSSTSSWKPNGDRRSPPAPIPSQADLKTPEPISRSLGPTDTPKSPKSPERLARTSSSSSTISSSIKSSVPSRPPTSPESKSHSSLHSGRSESTATPSGSGKRLSKLALLAQAKAEAKRDRNSITSIATSTSSAPSHTPTAIALQQLLDTPLSGEVPTVPAEITEYLTPVSNGSSVTTALTTTYHSLYSLTDPARSPVSPPPKVVQLHETPGSPEGKRSKLAMKIRKASEKQDTIIAGLIDAAEPEEMPVPPIFLSPHPNGKGVSDQPHGSQRLASPSPFASLLVDPWASAQLEDDQDVCGGEGDMFRRRPRRSSSSAEKKKHSSSQKELGAQASAALNLSLRSDKTQQGAGAFDFGSPSPDDIVFNARKGTSLGLGRAVSSKERTRSVSSAASSKGTAKKAN